MQSRSDATRRTQRTVQPPEQQRHGAAPSEHPALNAALEVSPQHGRARIARLEDALAFLEEGERQLGVYRALRGEDGA
jgi:hypothetical protein